jgi:hypothetical protein
MPVEPQKSIFSTDYATKPGYTPELLPVKDLLITTRKEVDQAIHAIHEEQHRIHEEARHSREDLRSLVAAERNLWGLLYDVQDYLNVVGETFAKQHYWFLGLTAGVILNLVGLCILLYFYVW